MYVCEREKERARESIEHCTQFYKEATVRNTNIELLCYYEMCKKKLNHYETTGVGQRISESLFRISG